MGDHLPPIKLSLFRKFLESQGLNKIGIKGDHEKWSRIDLSRPIIIPVKNKELSPFFIISNLKTLNISVEDFRKFINSKNN